MKLGFECGSWLAKARIIKERKKKDRQIENFLQNETFLCPREYLKAIDMTGREKHKEDYHWRWGNTKHLASQLGHE